MSMRIQTKDGAIGKSLKTTRTKKDDTEIIVCEIKAQMFVSRESFDDLCGRPRGWCSHFYDDLGAPVEAMSVLLIRRELEANGYISRGEGKHEERFDFKNATASSIRFRVDNHGAIMICTLTWVAADEDEIKPLLGQAVYVNLTYAESKQQKLGLGSAPVVADEKERQKKKGSKKKKRKGEQQTDIEDPPAPEGSAAPPGAPEIDDEDHDDAESGDATVRH